MNFLQKLKSNNRLLLLVILTAVFLFSLIFYLFNFRGIRYTFSFYISGSGKMVFETRVIPSVKGKTSLHCYVEELLLGPSVQRGKPVFPLGTKVLFCFEKGESLYLNLSEDAIYDYSPEADYKTGYDVLCMNVKRNFPKIKKVNLFIEGNSVFADDKNQ